MRAVLGGDVTSLAMRVGRVRPRRRRRRPDPHGPFLWRRLALFVVLALVTGSGTLWLMDAGDLWAIPLGMTAASASFTAWESWLFILSWRLLDDDEPEDAQRAINDAVLMRAAAGVLLRFAWFAHALVFIGKLAAL